MTPQRPRWAEDYSLCLRFADCVETMVRARWDFNRRMKAAMPRLRPLRPADFPAELQVPFEILLAADELARVQYPGAPDVFAYGRMTPTQRDQWCAALLSIYRVIVIDRHSIGLPL